MQKIKTFFNWSTGKDSALALYHLMRNDKYEVSKLLTSINAHYDRVSMHGLRRSLLDDQLKLLQIPCEFIELSAQPSMEEYEKKMIRILKELQSNGYTTSAFGDIFLEDLRKYRESRLQELNMNANFPIWGRDTNELAMEFFDLGFKAIVVCVNAELLDESFVGRTYDLSFIQDLPKNVDPCGENGEFHTFCYAGPIFNGKVPFVKGENSFKSYDDPKKDRAHENKNAIGFWFCDLLSES